MENTQQQDVFNFTADDTLYVDPFEIVEQQAAEPDSVEEKQVGTEVEPVYDEVVADAEPIVEETKPLSVLDLGDGVYFDYSGATLEQVQETWDVASGVEGYDWQQAMRDSAGGPGTWYYAAENGWASYFDPHVGHENYKTYADPDWTT